MFVLHCTQKLLDRLGPPQEEPAGPTTTRLGNWYATVIFWRPQVALLVSERTLLPVLMPLAPAATLVQRFPAALGMVLGAHGWSEAMIEAEFAGMSSWVLAKTASRSLLGVMNEFKFMAEACRQNGEGDDLLQLSVRLSTMPCKPIGHESPMRLVQQLRDAAAIGLGNPATH